MPEPSRGGARDGVVDPAWGNGVAEFVVEDGLEGGDDLGLCWFVSYVVMFGEEWVYMCI